MTRVELKLKYIGVQLGQVMQFQKCSSARSFYSSKFDSIESKFRYIWTVSICLYILAKWNKMECIYSMRKTSIWHCEGRHQDLRMDIQPSVPVLMHYRSIWCSMHAPRQISQPHECRGDDWLRSERTDILLTNLCIRIHGIVVLEAADRAP